MYSVSHPGKTGTPTIELSNESESSGASISPKAATEHVIMKVFAECGITVSISEKIRVMFRSKLWRMGQTLSKLGGTKRLNLLEKWKSTSWSFSIDLKEINQQLASRKHELEEQLESEKCKRQKMEESLKQEVKSLRTTTKKQEKNILSLKMGKTGNGRGSSSKCWSSYSREHRIVKRKQIVTDMKAAALTVCDKHFIPISMDIENAESGKRETINMQKGTIVPYTKEVSDSENQAHFALYVKDQFTLSDCAYRELSQLTPSLPRLYKLKQLTKELNSEFDILPSPTGYTGVQQSFKVRLMYRLQQLKLNYGETIQVKLTGDGTNIAKHVHVVNFAFTLLNEGSLASSPFGNHSLAILEIPECYDSLSGSLTDIIAEASELEFVQLNGNEHRVEYFLGGDLKFLAIACGIEAANSNFSCVWCTCSSNDRWDMDKNWSALDEDKGARTVKSIEACLKLPKTRRVGCCASPMFKFIPIDHVIIDSLHLFLRVSDLLINLLIQELRRQDGITRAVFDRTKHVNATAYENFLNEVCKIRFHWYTCKETKQMKWRDLSGPEKITLFKNIDIPKFFPAVPNGALIQDIWKEFWRLFRELEEHTNPSELQSEIKNWVRKFLRVYQTKNITPYVHAFAFHVPEFTERYGSICKFSQQGLEKLNDITTQHYLRSTNHHNTDALKQVMEKRNRLEQLCDEGYRRTPRLHHCRSCGEAGHTSRNCPSRPALREVGNEGLVSSQQ